MPQLYKFKEQSILAETSSYTPAKFPFERFNPVQSRVLEHYDKDINFVIASTTSSGKTCMMEMVATYELSKGGKFIYIAPMRALAKEKYDDWTDESHHFSKLNISICTGDYQLTEARKNELSEANIIILTPEMLSSRTRNFKSEKNEWLSRVSCLGFDESHLIGVADRGSHAEIGLMKFMDICPTSRLVLLSATIPNASEVSEWISTLNNKDTYLVESKYRPCPLDIHWVSYSGGGGYENNELSKITEAVKLINKYPEDKLLIFVHTKRTGVMLQKYMKRNGFDADFHSADLDKHKREALEKSFKSRDGLQYLIATSTLAWGCCARGTLIETPNGQKRIETLKEGDWVFTMSPTGIVSREILRTGKKVLDESYTITLESGHIIDVGLNHEFFTNVGYCEAKDLTDDDYLSIGFLKFSKIKNIEKHETEQLFYDIEVDEFHNYIGNGIVSHNCNTPARRVIILGVHRGLQEVETYDILQEIGRSGRPGFDPRGDAYILLPEGEEQYYVNKITQQSPIFSRLLDNAGGHYKTLAFHLVTEIHHGRIKLKDDVTSWYKNTLANFQTKELSDKIIDSTVDLLIKCGVIKKNEQQELEVTTVGKVASMFYYNPFDVADLRKNFTALFKYNKQEDNLYASIALANVDSARTGIVNKAEKEAMNFYQMKIWNEFGKAAFLDPAIKLGCCYHMAMQGKESETFNSVIRNIKFDFARQVEMLIALDTMGYKWNKIPFFKNLLSRVSYGVEPHLVPFVKLPDIGKVRAEKLWNAGIKNIQDMINNPVDVSAILNMKSDKILNIIAEAKKQV